MAVTTITTQTLTDDTGDNLSGTIVNNTVWQQLLTNINALIANAIVFGNSITERARSVAMGEWTTPTFAAGDYTASGAQTWTVAGGNIQADNYMRVGLTLFVNFFVVSTTVGGTPSSELRKAIPAGLIASGISSGAFKYTDNGTDGTGRWAVLNGGTFISFFKDATGAPANWSASTTNTRIALNCFFPVTT